jgi:hypothetical protein
MLNYLCIGRLSAGRTARILIVMALLCLQCLTASAESERQFKTQIWEDGTRYQGSVRNGKKDGKGTIIWPDGSRFVGYFKNDLRNGPGTMTLPDGTEYQGYFVNGVLAEPPSSEQQTATATQMTGHDASTDPVNGEQEAANTIGIHGSVERVDPAAAEHEVMADKLARDAEQSDPSRSATAFAVTTETSQESSSRIADPIPPVITIDEEIVRDVHNTLDMWAAAWSNQDVEEYLANYHADFKVPGNLKRRQWEVLRHKRITRPTSINVTLHWDSLTLAGPNTVDVQVKQFYKSNLYADTTTKRFRMKRADEGVWRILSETTIK